MFLGHRQFFKDFFQVAFLRYLLFWFAVVPAIVQMVSALPSALKIPGTDFSLTCRFRLRGGCFGSRARGRQQLRRCLLYNRN